MKTISKKAAILLKIYVLIGKSGTGKSYKSLELACENNIDYIIDDGLLIYKGQIIAGVSAKQSQTKMEAVRRAVFSDINHRESVKKKINDLDIDRILILGTSLKMVKQICSALELGEIDEIIDINDISTDYDIRKAIESRKKGNHIIPVPTVEIKKRINGLRINPLRRFFMTSNKEAKILEKTVIRPAFSYMGKFYIAPEVLNQIIKYTISKDTHISRINRISIDNSNGKIKIKVSVNIRNLDAFGSLKNTQHNIKRNVEEMTLINVDRIDFYINKIKDK